ncbi:hypothetical protein [Fibrella forsythiae]|uniref:O-antigen polysaccharide polymerase Wzy n=1 Tax=Fibrella forsythiae TaxID=2817061 RepID=A0ABS3JCQ7_9BACT|nr:hypothetical protein [Fibrella forsythiae]MBO0947784.1 hypothetical protein [Fibrella forsythiae]
MNTSDIVGLQYETVKHKQARFLNLVNINSKQFLLLFKKWSWIVLIISGILQLLLHWSIENLFGLICVFSCWTLTNKYVLDHSKLKNYSFSTLILLGFAITQYLLPTIFTLVENKYLVYNLKVPNDVFVHSTLAYITIIISHILYSNSLIIQNIIRPKIQKGMYDISFYKVPSDTQVWIIGMMGLLSMFVSYFYIKEDYNNYSEGASNKMLEGFIPFTYAPYLLVAKRLYGTSEGLKKGYYLKLSLFTLVLMAIGIGGNARALFINGIVSAGIAYFLGLLIGLYDNKLFKANNIIIAICAVLLFTGPVADIATSMVIVRDQRGSISKSEMLIKTLNVYRDKDAIRLYKLAANNSLSDWDEHYFDNLFLARFCNLKFNDKSLELSGKIGVLDEDVRTYSINRFLSIFPKPVLKLFQFNFDKDKVISSSYGDFLYMKAGGGQNALGGFRVGQFAGTGMAAFGWWYLVILGIGIIPVYLLMDSYVFRNKRSNSFCISLAGLLQITTIFMFLSLSSTSESVMNVFNFIVRGWLQINVLYYFVYVLSKSLQKLF